MRQREQGALGVVADKVRYLSPILSSALLTTYIRIVIFKEKLHRLPE